MSAINDGGPAFPFAVEESYGGNVVSRPVHGMSLRDYVAVHIASGLLANTAFFGPYTQSAPPWGQIMREVFEATDAFMAARGQK